MLSVPVDKKEGSVIEEYSLVFDSPSDKIACENTILMLQRTHLKTQETVSPASTSSILLDDSLEQALNPHFSPFALPDDALAMQRLDVYRELLCSEQTYIKDLTILQEAYEVPLYRDLTKKNCYLNKLELDSIFGNYHEILKIHTDFFNSIKTHISEARLSQLISQEFLKTSNQFYLYNDYCNSYYDALRLL